MKDCRTTMLFSCSSSSVVTALKMESSFNTMFNECEEIFSNIAQKMNFSVKARSSLPKNLNLFPSMTAL